jgi:hypothetical protein
MQVKMIVLLLSLGTFWGVSLDAKMRVTNETQYQIQFEYTWLGILPRGSITNWGYNYRTPTIASGETQQFNIGEVNLKTRYKVFLDAVDGSFELMLDVPRPSVGGRRHVTIIQDRNNNISYTDALW